MSGFNVELMNGFTSRPSQLGDSNSANKAGAAGDAKGASGVTFGDLLIDKIQEANADLKVADSEVQNLVAGRTKNVHGTMIALERADVSFKMLMQVRNKMIDAYREIMRMQV